MTLWSITFATHVPDVYLFSLCLRFFFFLMIFLLPALVASSSIHFLFWSGSFLSPADEKYFAYEVALLWFWLTADCFGIQKEQILHSYCFSQSEFGKFLWRILQHGKQNLQLPVWTFVHQTNSPKLFCWKRPRWSRNSVWLMEYTRMVQQWKMWKDANQLRKHVLSWNWQLENISWQPSVYVIWFKVLPKQKYYFMSETYLKPSQTSKMKLLMKVVNASRDVFRTVFSIQNVFRTFRTSKMELFTKIMNG